MNPPIFFGLRIVRREGIQSANERAWPLGGWLFYRPEVQDEMGPRGHATYLATNNVTSATFGSHGWALRVKTYMEKMWPGVIVQPTPFFLGVAEK